MKQLLSIISILALITLTTSCGKETCETCIVEQIIFEDGVETGSQTINSNQEYCGDALDAVKDLETTTTQEFGGLSIETRTTVTCQ